MKHNKRLVFLCLLLTAVLLLATGCADTKSPYEINDAENYTVSVKFDANGGAFTTNTAVIMDSFNLSQTQKDGEGMAQIALIPPESEARGKNKFEAVNNGHFFAGWYQECTVTEGENGEKKYNYSGKWDFENQTLAVDPNKEYSSKDPVMTLYAAWIPLFEIEYYAKDSDEVLATVSYDLTRDGEIVLPVWNQETGALDMNSIPAREGYTFEALYLDKAGNQKVENPTLAHSGVINYENATAENAKMKLYVEWREGQWYRISNADQLIANANMNGSYEILADLDFTDKTWPAAFMYGSFTGTIEGYNHTISNVVFEHRDQERTAAGLFGELKDTAKISDLTFTDVEFTLNVYVRKPDSSFGLLAGNLSSDAQITGLQIRNSMLYIDSGTLIDADNCAIGLVCGVGTAVLDVKEIDCKPAGDNPESIVVTVTDDIVTVTPA